MVTPIDDNTLNEAIATQFQCARCGHCCKGDGLVRFGAAEAERMAKVLGLSRHQLLKTYAFGIDKQLWMLRDRMVPGPTGEQEQWCIFLERDADGLYRCRLHEAKPDQCRDFPAKWTNPDSHVTCVGLRHLLAALRRQAQANGEQP